MSITINKRPIYGGGVIFASETATTVKEAIAEMRGLLKEGERLNLTGANLTGAYLTDADLTGANLTDANLTRADLTDAYLTDANLRDANLTRADLTRANLTDADLTDADLRDADLTRANLTRANLTDADLTRANLTDADLTDANLTRANLTDADLTDADLTRANLTDANLTDANLRDANLTRANLTDADLSEIRADIYRVLSAAPAEVGGLLSALREGRIDGSQYEGECACLVGTIANLQHCDYKSLPGIEPNASSPSERWFLAIEKGDTPANSQIAAITEEWIVEWLEANVAQVQEVTK